jgi:hypothetical protein
MTLRFQHRKKFWATFVLISRSVKIYSRSMLKIVLVYADMSIITYYYAVHLGYYNGKSSLSLYID